MIGAAAWALAGLSAAAFYSRNAEGAAYTLNDSDTSGSASWSQTGAWTGGLVANGANNTADFSENLLVGNLTITLDGNQTIGGLIFGDRGAAFNTTLATGTGGVLTLSAPTGSPVINVVNETATISAVIAGGSGLNKTGAGNLVLTAADTYTGPTTISGGTLTLDFSQTGAPASNIIGNSSPASLALTGDGALVIKGNSTATNSQSFGGVAVSSGADVITLNQNGAASLSAGLGAITQTVGGTLDFSIAPLTSGVVATTTNSVINGILGAWATLGTGSTTAYATVNGSNQIVAYTGATAATTGLANVTSATGNYTYSAAATLAGARTANTLQYTGAAATTALGANTLTLNGLLNTGSGLLTITRTGAGGIVIGATKELVILGSAPVTISAGVANNAAGASSLTYSGAGTLTLGTVASTYTGTTTVNSGTVTLSLANELNSASSVVVNGGALGTSTFAQSVKGVSLIGGSITGTTGALTSASAFDVRSGTASAILAGTAGLNKTTTGTVSLFGANTYSGLTEIDAGILNAAIIAGINTASGIGEGSAGGSAADLVFGGGALQYTGTSVASTNRLFTIGDANGNSAVIDSSATTAANTLSFTGTGSIAFANAAAHTLTLTGSNTGGNTFAPVIGDQSAGNATSFIKSGAGTWVLTGNNTYTGTTAISAGTLQIGAGGVTGSLGAGAVTDNGALILDRTDNYGGPLGEAISGSGALTLLAGSLTLDQTNSYSGTTTVSGGTLTLDFSQLGAPATNIIGSASALALGGGTLNVIGNAGATNSQAFAGLALNVGASSISDLNNGTGNSVLIALGPITRNTGGTINFNLPTTPESAANGFTTSTVNVNGILGGWATVGGQNWATNNGANIVGFSNYSTTTTGGNTAANYAAQNVRITSAVAFTSVIAPNSIDFANSAALTITLPAGTNVIASGGILVSSGATAADTITGGTLSSGNGQDLIVIQNGAANLNIGSVIANNGATAISLTKTGTGVLDLTVANTYTGTTRILAGTLQVGISNALPTGGNVILGDAGANTGGTLNLGGFIQLFATLSNVGSGQSIVTNSSNTAVGTLELTGVGSIFSGIIQDGASLGGVATLFYGGGSATLTGVNTYTGLTTLQNYNLTLTGGNNRLSVNDPVELNNNGVLHLGDATGASNQTLSSLIAGPLNTVNHVVGGNATQTSILTINNSTADVYQSYLGSGTADATVVAALNDLALAKTGAGTFTLGGGATTTTLSTYDGGTNINQGTLALGIANALPSFKSLTFGSGTLVRGAVNINGGALDLAGFSSLAGALTLANGGIVDSVGGGVLEGSSYAVQSGVVSAVLGDGASPSALTKTAAGTVVLSGVNTYTGGTSISAGTLVLGVADALSASGIATITGGTLALGAANGLASGGAVNVNGGVLDLAGFASAAGAVTLTSGSIINSGGAGAALSASGYTLQSGTVSAVLGGALSPLTKTGSGAVTLSAANTYGGATVVSAGVLNASAAQTGGGAFTVSDGATLGVDLTAAGQTLNVSSLAFGSATGASISLNLGSFGNPTVPVINANSFTLNGADTLNISGIGLSVGEFPLIAFTGAIGGSGSLALGTLPARMVANLQTTGNLTLLDVTAYDYLKWTGAVNGNWDSDPTGAGQQGTLNWQTALGGVATRYFQGTGGTDSVLFDDSAAGAATVIGGATKVNLTTTVTPISVTVNSSALNYIFGGPGKLSGGASLLKEGSGTLTLTNTGGNDYSGATTISAGVLQIGDGSTPGAGQLGSGSVAVGLGGTLAFDRPSADNIIVANVISGPGALVQNGGDIVTLTGNNLSYSGNFNVTAGTLAVGNANALGNASGTVRSGGTVDVSGFSISNPLTVNGGVLQVSSGGGTVSGPVSLGGAGNAYVAVGSTLTISGAIGGGGSFAENGGGLLILSGNNTYSGATTINAGTLQVGAGGFSGTLGDGAVIDSGTLAFDRIDSYGGAMASAISGIGGVTLSAGTLVLAGANTYGGVTAINAGTLQIGNGGVTGTLGGGLVVNSGVLVFDRTDNYGGAVSDAISGAGGLTLSAGTLVLSGTNSYTGITNIVAGTLELGSANAFGGGSDIAIVAAGATLDLGGFLTSEQLQVKGGAVTSSSGVSGGVSGAVLLTGASTFDAPASNTVSFTGPISGSGTLTKTSGGTIILSGSNSFTGNVTLTMGVIDITGSQALGIGPKVISVSNVNRPSLKLDGSGGAISLDPSISFSLSSDGTEGAAGAIVNLAGNNTINGSLSMVAGGGGFARIQSLGGTLTLAGSVNANGSSGVRTLLLGGSANGVVSGVVADGVTNGVSEQVSVSKDGAGAWLFSGPNTYTGSTVVDSGTIALSGAGSLATTLISIYSGALFELDNTSVNSSSRISSAGVALSGGVFDYISNSSGSTQTAGTLTMGSGGSVIVMGGANGTLTFSSLTSIAGSTMNLSVPGLAATNLITFTTAPTLTGGILARVTVTNVGSFDFATYNSTDGVAAFTGYNASTTADINAAGATDTVEVTSSYGVTTLGGSKTLNALAISGSGLLVSGLAGSTLTLTSGGVLVTGGSDVISVPVLAFGATGGIFSINSGSTLTLASVITGTAGFVKADGGGLTLTSPSSNTFTTTVNGGALTLAAGANSLYPGGALTVNGGALELNGNSQYAGILSSGGNITGAGGIVDNASATTSTFATNSGGGTVYFGGQLTGDIYFSRAASSSSALMYLTNNETYTGGTLLTGGVTTLIDQGTLSGTSSIALDYATLSMSNTGTLNLPTRIPVGAPITMRGGALSFLGRAETASAETVGVVTLVGGLNTINSAIGGTGVNSADLTLTGFGAISGTVAGFSDANASGSVVNFTGTNLGASGSASRIDISGATPISVGLVNNILPWAVVNGGDFASYIPYTSVNGVSAGGIGALGTMGYAGYDNTNLPSASAPAQNVEISTTQSLPSTSGTPVTLTINSLKMNGVIDLNFINFADTLNLVSGGLLRNGAGSDTIGGLTSDTGNLTAGGGEGAGIADLYLYNNQGQLAVESAIINNPNGAVVRLVISGGGTTTLGFNAANAPAGMSYSLYSGGLVVNGGTVDLTNNTVLPGGNVTLNATTFNTSSGSAFSSNPFFTLNNSLLYLLRSTVVAGLTFYSSGSSGNLVTLSGYQVTLTLPSDGSGITSNPTSVSANDIATIKSSDPTGALSLNGVTQTITVLPTIVNGVNIAPSQAGLVINSVIVDNGSGSGRGAIDLKGGGLLQLTGANTYTGATVIDAGILNSAIIAGINAPSGIGEGSPGGSAVDLVFGGGALQYMGTSPASTNRLFTIGDANGNSATIDSSGAASANTLSFIGTGSIAFVHTAAHTLTLTGSNAGANTFAPVIGDQSAGNATSLIKSGAGTWVLTGTNTYSGATTISAGILQIGAGGVTGSLGAGAVIDNGTLILDRTDNYGGPLSNAISGSGGLTLLAGTPTLDGTYTYSGPTTVLGGTLTLDFSLPGAPAANIVGSSSSLALGGATLEVIGNSGAANSQVSAGLTLDVGASTISDVNNATANSVLITLGGISRNTGGTINFILPTTPGGATNGITTSTANTNGILGGWATVGQNWATNNGADIVAFSNYYTTTTGGNTAANYAAQNVQVNSAPTFASVVTPNSLDFASSTALTVTLATGLNVVDSGGILVSSAATAADTITGGTLTSGNGQDLIVIQNGSANLNIGSVIANNGSDGARPDQDGTGSSRSDGCEYLYGDNACPGRNAIQVGVVERPAHCEEMSSLATLGRMHCRDPES